MGSHLLDDSFEYNLNFWLLSITNPLVLSALSVPRQACPDKRALAPVFAPKVAGGGVSKAAPRQLLTSVGCASLARSGGGTQFPAPRRKVGGAQPPPAEETTLAPRATRSIRSVVAFVAASPAPAVAYLSSMQSDRLE